MFSSLFSRFMPFHAAQPFAALPAAAVAFVPDDTVHAAAHDYFSGNRPNYRANLPLVIGHARPDWLARLDALATQFPHESTKAYANCYSSHFKQDDERTQRTVARKIILDGADESSDYAKALRREVVAATIEIVRWDRRQFGSQSDIDLDFQHERVSAHSGRHTHAAGHWHRDMLNFSEKDPHLRLYFFRSRYATEMVPNSLTEHLPVAAQHNAWTPLGKPFAADGAFVLAAGGEKGTMHRSQRPPAGTPMQPSLFYLLTITPG